MARALWRTRSDRGEQAQGEDNDSSAHQLFGLKEPSRFRSRTWLYWWAIVEAIVLTGLAYWLAWDFETESGVQAGGVVLIAIAVWTIIVLLFLARGDDRESGWTGALALLIRSGYYPFAAGAVVAVAFAYRNGSADAALQRQFLGVEDRSVRRSATRVRRSRSCRAPGRLSPDRSDTVIVLNLGDDGAREFERRYVGPLRLARATGSYSC